MRVEDEGKSECLFVMKRIEIELSEFDGNIVSHESEQTSLWCFITRKLVEPFKEAKQMTIAQAIGAVSRRVRGWHSINWSKAHREVKRLQARIVKAAQEGR